jgi:TRAP-type C4-dicarboxylate transport system permease small subunit
MIYQTRNKVNLLVSWMLPGLYGLLGACVFLMRELLLGNKARGDARIVDMLSLLLRVALGGLAGIIVGWFWVPTTPNPASSAIEVSSVSFGVAFLAGFSIDSLFALLDRLLKNFRPADVEKPAAAPAKLEGEA